MLKASEADSPGAKSTSRIEELAHRAAHVQDLLGDLEMALVRGEDPMSVLSVLKVEWRQFRDDALNP